MSVEYIDLEHKAAKLYGRSVLVECISRGFTMLSRHERRALARSILRRGRVERWRVPICVRVDELAAIRLHPRAYAAATQAGRIARDLR
jgi:hypothetical protein